MDRSVPSMYPHVMQPLSQKEAEQASLIPPPNQNQILLLGPVNTDTICVFCRASIKTAVKYTSTSRTHIAAALCCLMCCMCCIPYASDTAKNADHYCPNCRKYLGTYHR